MRMVATSLLSVPELFHRLQQKLRPIKRSRHPLPQPVALSLLLSVFVDVLAYVFKMEQRIPGERRSSELQTCSAAEPSGVQCPCLGPSLCAFTHRPFTLVLWAACSDRNDPAPRKGVIQG